MDKCFSGELLSIELAQEKMLSNVTTCSDIMCTPLSNALGRVLANDVIAPIDVPPFDTSAMDGYAIRHDDIQETGTTLPLSQTISAGSQATPLAAGSTARILTGAPVPRNADTVVIQENCAAQGNEIRFNNIPGSGANIRKQGCHIHQHQQN